MTENELLKDLYNKSPLKDGLSIKQYVKGQGKHTYYNLFSWITGEKEDKWISFAYFGIRLKKLGLSSQLYYDVVVLGISDINDRPKCRYCGTPSKFDNMSRGYFDFCNLSCTAKWGNKVPSKIKNVSKALTGKKLSKEHREACSRGAIKRLIKEGIRPGVGYHNVKRGKYIPNKSNGKELSYLSGWELEFMKLIDNDKYSISIDSIDFRIPYYSKEGILKNYLPDFKIVTDSGTIVIVEIKPKRHRYIGLNLLKRIAGKKYCSKHNYKYVVLTEEELFSNSAKNGGFSIIDYIL